MKQLCKLTLAALLASASLAFANDTHHASATATSSEASAPMSEGEVKKVDKSAGKLTIKHGPLVNLDMPPMTMVFRVKEPTMLDQVTAGDKISFVAEKVGGQITVTKLEPKK